MELGADLGGLDLLAQRFDVAGDQIRSAAAQLERSLWTLSPRFGYDRQQMLRISQQMYQHANRLDGRAQLVMRQRDAQYRVSGDRVGFTAVHLPSVRRGPDPRAMVRPAGLGRVLGLQAVKAAAGSVIFGAASGVTRLSGARDWAGHVSDSYGAAQSMRRAFVKFPHAPRKVSTTLTQDVKGIGRRYKGAPVSTATRAKYLKEGTLSIGTMAGGIGASWLETHGANEAYRNFGAGAGKTLNALTAIDSAQKLIAATSGATKLVGRAAVVAKVGGAFAIVGGVIGLAGNITDYSSKKITGWRALRDGSLNAATIVGGVLMFTPAAPIGAVILAGAAVLQAAAWAYDNRAKIASFVSSTAKKVTASAPYRAAVNSAPVKAVVSSVQVKVAVQLTKKLTVGVSKLLPKFGRR
jgi:hypothetical protein